MDNASKIHRITLDITYANPPVANHALTGRIRNLFDEELAAAIDVAFVHNESDEKFYIDTCVIDLGEVDEKDFSSLLKSRLQKQLAEIQQSIDVATSNKITQAHNYSTEDIVVYFLTTGRLPWYAPLDTTIDTLFIQLLTAEQSDTFIKRLLLFFSKQKQAIYRFAIQFEMETIVSFFKQAITLLPNVIRPVSNAWLRIIQTGNTVQANTEEAVFLLGNYLAEVVNASVVKDKITLIHSFITQVVRPSTSMNESQAIALQTALAENSSASVTFVQSLITAHIINVEQKDHPTQPKQSESVHTPASDEVQPGTGTEKDAIAIENAGIVLFNPFLPHLFKTLQLVEKDQFISIKQQEKAAQVLHYIATGNKRTPEQLLPLCKLLVGLPLQHPVGKLLKLTSEEVSICDDLLAAVIENWPVIKNTSPEGLRQSFIQRKGTMVQDADEWMVTVERKTIDILLDQLPWSFGIIKHPWNKSVIHVRWI